jgi:hypothetical protein
MCRAVVSQIFTNWNPVTSWLHQVDSPLVLTAMGVKSGWNLRYYRRRSGAAAIVLRLGRYRGQA